MDSLWHRLWNTSPGSFTAALARRTRRWSARAGWHRVEAGPLKDGELYFDGPVEGGLRDMVRGTFEQFLHEAITARVTLRDCVCWDVGGHVGYHALALAALGARVIAFEPGANNIARFRRNVARNAGLSARIELRELALADREGELSFVLSDDLSGASSGSHLADAPAPGTDKTYAAFRRTTVPTARADQLITRGCPVPRVIKLDVEGAELLVLQGARELLAQHRPLLFIEVHHILVMLRLQPWLRELGYTLTPLDEANATAGRCFVVAEPG